MQRDILQHSSHHAFEIYEVPSIRIAVIGSGIAGLSAAYWLSQEADIEVTLLEKNDRIGMDAHRLDLPRLDLPQDDDQILSVDVPSRMFNASQWPRLVKLYDELGVAYERVNATQSFSHFSHATDVATETFLKLDVAFRPQQAIRKIVRAQSRKLLSEAARLMKEGPHDLDAGLDPSQTLRQYLLGKNYSTSFRDAFLYPTLSSTVCTCSFAGLDDYPARIVLSALRRLTDDRDLMRTSKGTQDVVSRLSSPSIDVQTNYTASTIIASEQGVKVTSYSGTVHEFDHVIMATQANTALKLLPAIEASEIDLLKTIPYEDVPIVVHRDARMMPKAKSDWCTFNMGVSDAKPQASAMCSVWLNRFHDWSSLPDHFQTIMPVVRPDPSSVLAEIHLQRPIVNAQSVRALALLEQLHRQPDRRIWYCGSWASEGIPLLETGVVSAERVVKAILSVHPGRRG
jgi:predicted NAD/FAD-binding protein